ncbi:hypothetical protein A1Q2_07410 [Trichosporon asahii var. asahii CBS 8904]|uniref:Uncharacterized protein n=1 Tax=Trichosporon asahii var. asahii (strain CBS 8904) TaxID=1220162 RepID=K1VH17_TRIAC|nr:hypothetical protein A1Q2_07410 [Trichosporon asahii var. asahii CBS 8904]
MLTSTSTSEKLHTELLIEERAISADYVSFVTRRKKDAAAERAAAKREGFDAWPSLQTELWRRFTRDSRARLLHAEERKRRLYRRILGEWLDSSDCSLDDADKERLKTSLRRWIAHRESEGEDELAVLTERAAPLPISPYRRGAGGDDGVVTEQQRRARNAGNQRRSQRRQKEVFEVKLRTAKEVAEYLRGIVVGCLRPETRSASSAGSVRVGSKDGRRDRRSKMGSGTVKTETEQDAGSDLQRRRARDALRSRAPIPKQLAASLPTPAQSINAPRLHSHLTRIRTPGRRTDREPTQLGLSQTAAPQAIETQDHDVIAPAEAYVPGSIRRRLEAEVWLATRSAQTSKRAAARKVSRKRIGRGSFTGSGSFATDDRAAQNHRGQRDRWLER